MRDTFIIIGLTFVAAIIGAYILFTGNGSLSSASLATGASDNAAAVAIPFTKLAQGEQSSVSTRVNYLITSKSQLEELWKMLRADGQMPNINFATSSVIAVFAGKEPTAGYAIAVSKITDGEVRAVTITITTPASACPATRSMTAPYQVVEVPKSPLSLTHEDQTATAGCPQNQ